MPFVLRLLGQRKPHLMSCSVLYLELNVDTQSMNTVPYERSSWNSLNFSVEFKTHDGRITSKVYFVAWYFPTWKYGSFTQKLRSPRTAHARSKMLYSTERHRIRGICDGCLDMNVGRYVHFISIFISRIVASKKLNPLLDLFRKLKVMRMMKVTLILMLKRFSVCDIMSK
jgi:hypothetical protein